MKKKLIILGIVIIVALWIYVLIKVTNAPKVQEETSTTSNSNTVQWELTLEITAPEEEPADEKRSSAPAEIKQITEKNWTTMLTLDMLTMNPDFQPGITDFFINQNPKLREFAITAATTAFNCGAGSDNNENTPDVSVSIQDMIATMQQQLTGDNVKLTYYFDIANNTITSIHQQCLP